MARAISTRESHLDNSFKNFLPDLRPRRPKIVLYEYAYDCIFMLCRNCHAIPQFATWLAAQDVTSQEELRRRLYRRGHRVTQATLSRDIHELRLVKTPRRIQVSSG